MLAQDIDLERSEQAKNQDRNKKGEFTKEGNSASTNNGNGNGTTTKESFPKEGLKLIANPPSTNIKKYIKEAKGNYNVALKKYFDNELRGGIVQTFLENPSSKKEEPTDVVFGAKARKEFLKFQGNTKKILEVLPYLPEVILKGSYSGRLKDKKKHKGVKAFHTIMKNIKIGKNKPITCIIDLIERNNGKVEAYNVNVPKIPTFKMKKDHVEQEMKKRGERKRKTVRESNAILLSNDSESILLRGYHEPLSTILAEDSEKVKLFVNTIRLIDPETGEEIGAMEISES